MGGGVQGTACLETSTKGFRVTGERFFGRSGAVTLTTDAAALPGGGGRMRGEERRQTEGYWVRLQTGSQEKKKEIYKWHTVPSVKAELRQFVKVEGVSKIHR